MVPSVQNILFPYIDDALPSLLAEWERFIAQLRPAVDPSHTHNTQEFIITQLHALGMAAGPIAHDIPLIYAELSSNAPRTLLLYHNYTVQPFDERSFAPIATFITGIKIYQQLCGSLPINIKWLIAGEKLMESTQWEAILTTHSERLQADACIWGSIVQMGDMIPFIALGTKGLLRIEMAVHTQEKALPSHYGAIAPNAAWRLLWALNSIKDPHEDIRIEGFYDTVVSTDDEEIELVQMLLDHTSSLMGVGALQVARTLLGLQGFQLYYAHLLTPTCTVYDIVSKGPSAAFPHPTLPTEARAYVDFHLVPNQDPEDIFARLQQHLQDQSFDDIQVRVIATNRAVHTPFADPFVQAVRRATIAAYGETARILPMTAESYPLSPLQRACSLPIVITAMNFLETPLYLQSAIGGQSHPINSQAFASAIKQVVMIIEEFSHGTDTTE